MSSSLPPGHTAAITSVAQLLEHAAAIWADSPAVSFEGETFTWAETVRRCRNLAVAFRELGVQRGDRVAYLGFNSHANFELFFAPALLAAALVPINFRLSLPEMIDCTQDAQPTLLVVDDHHLHQGRTLAKACPSIRALVHAGGRAAAPRDMLSHHSLAVNPTGSPPAEAGDGDDVVVLFYTGGTTGRSKGVMLSHANLLANARGTAPLYEMEEREVYLLASPMFHAAAGSRIYTATLMGAHTVILSRFDAGDAITTIERHRVNCLQLVPTMIRMILDYPRLPERDLSSLRMISYGAAPMPVSLLQETMRCFPQIRFYQAYGMTEASPVVCMLSADDHRPEGNCQARLESVGRPVPHVQVRIFDENGDLATHGKTGEIVVKGPNVMRGYWRAPKLTAKVLVDGWYRTGDAGHFNSDGYLVLDGRIKDMIVSGGENVYPIEVENVLSRHPAVHECAVIGVPHPRWGEAVHAVVRLHDGHRVSERALIGYCRDHIAHYKCPAGVTFREEPMPLSGVNKILKSKLKSELRKLFAQ